METDENHNAALLLSVSSLRINLVFLEVNERTLANHEHNANVTKREITAGTQNTP